MKAKSAKQKGNKLESYIAKMYQRKLDPQAKRMPRSGAVEGFKADILKRFVDNWSDECKWQEPDKRVNTGSLPIWKWWEQTVNQCSPLEKPVLHVYSNYKEHLTIIRTSDYFDMREELEDWRNQNN